MIVFFLKISIKIKFILDVLLKQFVLEMSIKVKFILENSIEIKYIIDFLFYRSSFWKFL